MTRLIGLGSPEPIGVVPIPARVVIGQQQAQSAGINVAVFAPNAEAIDVCLYDARGDTEIDWVRLPGRTGDVHHGFIGDVYVGDRYGLRAHGAFAPNEGHRYNPLKLLVDPFALTLDRPFRLDASLFDARMNGAETDEVDSGFAVPKAIVTDPLFVAPRKPLRDWRDLVIYEMHVKGFTQLHPDIPPEIRGTFAGLAHPAAIRHLSELGVTAVELMPCAAGLDEQHLLPLGLTNYWGYNPITHMAPDPRLAPGGWAEIRAAVDALHEAGIAVILDVVLNHTGEGGHLGPTVSMRGLDNAGWYRLSPEDRSRYIDDAGCGNVLAADRPIAVRLMLETLRTWAMRAGLDGFRFDLATTIARGDKGFEADHPFLTAISQDPVLRELILIAEPWDLGWGGYQLGSFPTLWGEWNDRSRDIMRRFWRGDGGLIGSFTTSFAGSADVFAGRRRPLSRSINFITAHDGFTLADLVSHERKHNEANGEDNRDGTDANSSWNHGVEGWTDDARVRAARARDVRALLATLILSRGTPMLSMGDELGRSQGGNNNAYAQDNPISWVDWKQADRDLAGFTARLIRLRQAHPAFSGEAPLTGEPLGPGLPPDVVWLAKSGQPMADADWADPNNRLLVALYGADASGRLLVAVNAGWQDDGVVLPDAGEGLGWTLDIDTSVPDRSGQLDDAIRLFVPARSVVVLHEVAEAGRTRRQTTPETPADTISLDTLARSAGIQPEWWEVSGRHVQVPEATKRAILASMGYPAETQAEIRDSLAAMTAERFGRAMPKTIVAREGGLIPLKICGDLARATAPIGFLIRRGDGSIEEIAVSPRTGREETVIAPDGSKQRIRQVRLPAQPIGRHRLMLAEQSNIVADLIVAPRQCYLPVHVAHGERHIGISAHLYTLRRAGDQGVGDFTTLKRFAELAANMGARTLGLNPLHAMFAGDRDRASPYQPSDRRFLDPIYIDVTNLPASLRGEAVRTAIWSETRAANALSGLPDVDYVRVWQSKKKVLDLAFQSFERLLASGVDTSLVQEFDAFIDHGGQALHRFAEFQVISEEIGNPNWPEWPEDIGSIIRSDRLEAGIRYHVFLQWLAERQLAEASNGAAKAGLILGFYRDLAVGCAPDGAEAWATRGQLMTGVSIGAPPDPFSATGQIWSLPPPNPRHMADGGYAGFSALIASNMAHAGALRIDHAMGLRRLFLVPDGMSGAEGAYVDMPFEDLLGVLALESQRAQCLVVGEDLGTVPEGFRERLSETNVLAYKVLWFERDGNAFTPPRSWPERSAACISTHDLATLAGWWDCADIFENLSLRRMTAEEANAAEAMRAEEKSRLVDLLVAEGLIVERPDLTQPLDIVMTAAIHRLIAAAPCLLTLAQADDLAGETRAVNLPGTDRERANWRRKLRPDIDAIFTSPLAIGILDAMRGAG